MTIGSFALVFLTAFENLAVATVMPVISRELDGASLYAVAFSAPLAASVVGMVLAGSWSDRRGPRGPLLVAVTLFVIGLIIAGLAPSMTVIVVGRLVYGFASGGISVALYVVVGRTFPESLQPQVFGSFAAAWIFPALIGPAIAGIVADSVGWRWVFIGVVVIVALSVVMLLPALRRLRGAATDTTGESMATAPAGDARRILFAIVLALAVLVLSLVGELAGFVELVVGVAALVVIALVVRPLVPTGSLRIRRGLGGVVAVRGIIAAAYFGAEIYLPYLLTGEFHLTPALAGLSLTGAGITWGIASTVQGRFADRLSVGFSMTVGIATVILSIAAALVTALFVLSPWVAIAGWAIGGIGMGMVYPRLSVLILGYSTPADQGVNSAGLSIADSVGPAVSLAVLGILFQAVNSTATPAIAFSAVLGLACLFAVAALVASPRVSLRRSEAGTTPNPGPSAGD